MKNNYISKLHFISRHLVTLLVLGLLFIGVGSVSGATRYSVNNGNWSSTNTWSETSNGGSGASVPTVGDDVYIENDRNVTIDIAAACKSLNIVSGDRTSYIVISNTNSLTVSGAVTINRGTGSGANKYISVGTGTLTCASIWMEATGNNNRYSAITLSTGTVNVSGNISMNDSRNYIRFQNTNPNTSYGTLNVGGNMTGGTLVPDIGTVNYNGSAPQTVGNYTYYNLTMSEGGTKTLNGATTVTGTLLLASGNLVSTTANLLSITNTTKSAIMGGSPASYIKGPVKWTIPNNNVGATYLFPVGKTTYLPLSVNSPSQGWKTTTLTVEAFDGDAGGSIDGTLASASNLEYWSLQTVNLKYCSISLGKNEGIYPYDAIAASLTKTDTYTSLGGTPDFYSISNSSTIQIDSSPNRFLKLGRTTTPRINIAPTVLGGFGYTFNFGPSNVQQFTVNGTSLLGDIIITAPTNFEISTSPSIGFQQSITLPRVGSLVSNTTLYIRLKAGLPVATYSEPMAFASTGVTTKNIICSGTVFATTPTILTSGGRTCPPTDQIQLGSSSNDITILYWTGPNSYYSQEQNPVLGPPTTSTMNGTYTVTGSLPIGANLVINGDFEQGDAGFLSSYKSATNLVPEGLYAIVANPQSVHGTFSTDPDHTAAPGTLQMVINGAIVTNVTVWSQTIAVTPNSNYQFSYWLQSVVGYNPSKLQTFANNQAIGTTFTATTQTGIWTQYFYNWNSGSNTSVTIDIRNQNTVAGGNDFALDDIVFRAVTQVSSSVNVTASLAAAVNISTASTTITEGTNSIFTATPTNGGTSPLYQWSVNGTNIGTNSSSAVFNYVPSNGDVITCVMTSNNSCTIPKTATASITMTVTGDKNYWIGAVGVGGTVWSDPDNWTAHKVPASGDNVEFATEGNNGGVGKAAKNDLYLDYNRVVGNLINNASGRNLIIHADKELVVNNKILLTPVTDPTKKYDQIQIKADNTGKPNGSLIFYNPESEAVNATIEFYSKAYKEATPIVVPTGSYSYNWQLFGVPLTSVTADPTFYGSYVREYQENKPGLYTKWVQLNNASVLEPFKGYEITQLAPKIITFKGTLVNQDKTISLPVTAKESTPPDKFTSVYFRGQHIVSNPYAAAIDAREIVYGPNTESTAYLYNTGSFAHWYNNGGSTTYDENSATAGQYIALPKATAGSNNVPFDIPSMSGFLVKATDTLVVAPATPSPGSIQIKYSSVIVKNVHPLRIKKSESVTSTDLISTKIDLIGLHYSDRMWIFTEPSCTKNFDNGWDGRKILGSSLAPQIYAVEPDGDYQVNSVADMHNTDIAFQPGDEVEYTLKFTNENIKQKYAGIYLQDLVENKTIDVTESGTTYKFATAPASEPSKRFKIITRYYEKDAPDTESSIKIFSARGTVFIQNLSTYSGECTLYDVLGRAITKKAYGPNSVTEVGGNLTLGAYITTAITNGEKVSKRVIVQ